MNSSVSGSAPAAGVFLALLGQSPLADGIPLTELTRLGKGDKRRRFAGLWMTAVVARRLL